MKRIGLIVTLIFCALSLEAEPLVSFGGGMSASWYQAIVEDDEDLPFRSAIEGTFYPSFGFTFDRWGVHTYVPLSFVSPSKEFNDKQLKACMEIGLGCEGEYFFTDLIGLMGTMSANYGRYLTSDEGSFFSLTFGLGPLFNFRLSAGDRLVLSAPICVDVRDDVKAPTLGIALTYYHDWRL